MAKSDTSSDNTDFDYSLTSNHIVIVSHSVSISRPWQAEEESVNSITETTKEDLNNIPEVLPELKKTYFFGCGPCHPQWLQIFASKKFFTLMLFFSTLLQGAIVLGKLCIYYMVCMKCTSNQTKLYICMYICLIPFSHSSLSLHVYFKTSL